MKTAEFIDLLKAHKQKELYIEYSPGKWVAKGFHITEIKNIKIDAVDCGGRSDLWNETIIQLWEDPEKNVTELSQMKIDKALSILNIVDASSPIDREAVVRFEYGNENFHMAQLFVEDAIWNEDKLVLKLSHGKTDCKAKDACGILVPLEENKSCTPGGGCC